MNRPETEQELLSVLRDREASTASFRKASDRLSRLLSAKTLSVIHRGSQVATTMPSEVMIVPVMRAAMALVPAFIELFPGAPVGIVGMERDEETSKPHLYYNKLPEVLPGRAVIVDPMLATGGTARLVAEMLIERGCGRSDTYFTGVLAAPEGMNRLSKSIPLENIVVAAVDRGLDDRNFIVPGLGDYGDRYYGT